MSLRDLANADAALTVEGAQAGNADVHLNDKKGNEWTFKAILTDIGLLFDAEGNAIAGRTVCATYRSERVQVGGKVVEPEKGWGVKTTDLTGREWNLIVTHALPDRTIGLTRFYMELDLSKPTRAGVS